MYLYRECLHLYAAFLKMWAVLKRAAISCSTLSLCQEDFCYLVVLMRDGAPLLTFLRIRFPCAHENTLELCKFCIQQDRMCLSPQALTQSGSIRTKPIWVYHRGWGRQGGGGTGPLQGLVFVSPDSKDASTFSYITGSVFKALQNGAHKG